MNEVCTLASQLEHPHGRIFRDFVAAQRDFVPDDSKKLHFFYHRLGIESSRDETLAAALPENVPNIEEYRQIWQAHKNMKTPWLTARLKRERE